MSSTSSEHGSDSLSHLSIPNFQLQIPLNREHWRQWRINFEAYAGSNKFLDILNGKYVNHPDTSTLPIKADNKGGTRPLGVMDSYWQFYQKYLTEKDMHVAKAWNPIIAIAAQHQKSLF